MKNDIVDEGKRRRIPTITWQGWLLIVLVVLCVLGLGGTAYAFSRSGAPSLGGLLSGFAPQRQPLMGVNDCSAAACHGRPNDAAKIYVAVNGVEVHPDQVVALAAGDSFEMDFHFQGMLGDPKRFQGVGMQIVIPPAPWRIKVGTSGHPAGWSPSGQDGTFWSPGWDSGAGGDGAASTKWVAAEDRPEAYHLALEELPLKPDWSSVVFNDRGVDGADVDTVPDHMGADAIVTIPGAATPGRYAVTVSGVGHDARGNRAMVSLMFIVELAGRSPLPMPTAVARSGEELYQQVCRSCHDNKPDLALGRIAAGKSLDALVSAIGAGKGKMPAQGQANGGLLSAEEVRQAAEYAQRAVVMFQRASQSGGPPITHTVRGRLLCLVCHGPSGVKPIPKSHVANKNEDCNGCHRAPTGGAPLIPHNVQIPNNCLSCHARNSGSGVRPLTPDHGDRRDFTCTACHFASGPLPEEDVVPALFQTPGAVPTAAMAGPPATAVAAAKPGQPPDIAHTLVGRSGCLICHNQQNGLRPMPATHYGRREISCLGCHHAAPPVVAKPSPIPTATPRPTPIDDEPPFIPHVVAGREACLNCHHEGNSILPVPGSHAGRTDLSCRGCHRVPLVPTPVADSASQATPTAGSVWAPPAVSHDLAGREDCLSCHSGLGGHDLRLTNDLCGDCHKGR